MVTNSTVIVLVMTAAVIFKGHFYLKWLLQEKIKYLKGALDNILKFSFGLIPFIRWKLIAYSQIQEEKFKRSFLDRRNRQVLLSMHKVGMRLISIHVSLQNMLILHKNVIIYKMFSYFLVSVQRSVQKSFRIFLWTRIMVVVMTAAAIFKSHFLKIAAAGKY